MDNLIRTDSTFDYFLSTGYNKMDFGKITQMLAQAFWSMGISENEVVQGARNSALVVGTFLPDNEQVGYA